MLFQGVHFASCKESRLQINGFNSLDDAASAEFNQEIVFDTNPHFCGKEVVSDQAILVNQGYFNPKIVLSYSGQNPTKPDFFEFYYSVRKYLATNCFLVSINGNIGLVVLGWVG